MLSKLFLGMSLIGAEWVLYCLLLLSVLSVSLIIERFRFYRSASRGLKDFRDQLRQATIQGKLTEAVELAKKRTSSSGGNITDLESEMALTLLTHPQSSSEILGELAQDAVVR